MTTLKASQIEKGNVIFMFGAWDFNYGVKKTENASKETGKWVYTPRTIDTYFIHEVTVYSCGKKRMYLMDENGMKGADFWTKEDNGDFYSHFSATKELAEAGVKELHENNKFAQPEYKIVYR